MILIKSKAYERTTDQVIDWLDYLKADFLRINDDNPIVAIEMSLCPESNGAPDFLLNFKNGQTLDTRNVDSFWARRGRFKLDWDSKAFEELLSGIDTVRDSLDKEIQKEWETLETYLMNTLATEKRGLSNPPKEEFNKLEVLSLAAKAGLKIPPTFIANQKKSFKNFPKGLITKAMSEAVSMKLDGDEFYALTTCISEDKLDQLDDQFFPSYFQSGIVKDYELRVFYLDGELYSMAIFSQLDEQTSDDFRAYNWEKPNRNVPYQLPEDIAIKLVQLMKKLNLNTGSIDLIVDKKGEYYFLEVNPVGQFGMVSYPCNYNLERKVAEYLTKDC